MILNSEIDISEYYSICNLLRQSEPLGGKGSISLDLHR